MRVKVDDLPQEPMYIRRLVFLLKQNMPGVHLRVFNAPQQSHCVRWRAGDDERMKMDARICQPRFDVFDGSIKLNFGIRNSNVSDAFRVDEDDVLLCADE